MMLCSITNCIYCTLKRNIYQLNVLIISLFKFKEKLVRPYWKTLYIRVFSKKFFFISVSSHRFRKLY